MSSQKIMEQVWENIPEDKSIAILATGSIIGGSLPFLAGYLVPVSMSYFGVIIPGIGTIHSSVGLSAFLQSFSYTSPIYSGILGSLPGIATYAKKMFGRKLNVIYGHIMKSLELCLYTTINDNTKQENSLL